MAEAAQQPPVSAQVVGNAFVNQYYQILHHSPELVHRFYQEISKLGRPEGDGRLSLTTTMQAINEKILSLNYGDFKAEIKSVDAQESFNGGVSVLVTGCLEGKDKTIQNFTQMFFLAPQAKGYFVLNDMFQYVGKKYENEDPCPAKNEVEAPLTPQQECLLMEDTHISEFERTIETAEVNGEEEVETSDVGQVLVIEEEVTMPEVVDDVPDNAHVERETNSKTEETPKKSYASIVMVRKENPMLLSSPPRKLAAKIPEQELHTQSFVSATETPVAGIEPRDNGNYQEGEGDGYSVYIKGLSLHATPAQLEEEFKKYGPIKYDGIQVRSNKQGFCFGFVEFEEAIAVEKAIEASPVMIGGRQASVEEKKSTNTRASFRGRSSSGRGPGFRNEGTRGGRGNYGNGRGYNNDRGESNGRSEFGSRGNGRGGGGFNTRRDGDGFQSVGPRSNRGGGGFVAKAGPAPVSVTA